MLPYLSEADKKEIDSLLKADIWLPLPGPQTMAYESTADVVGYGGAAGGGKTDLAIGIALTKHTRAAIFRREGTQLEGIIDRLETIIGTRDGYNGQKNTWKHGGLKIEFGSCPHPGDERKYQGRPKDLLVIDEAANFLESQVRFLMGWVRTTDEKQHCQTLLTFNPPTDNDGEWIVRFFAPWLDPMHINPAKPGEIRFFAMMDGEEIEVKTKDEFLHNGELIRPQSRTFIPSKVMDNPFLVETGYIATLQALPEPLRSQMLRGDFMAGKQDNPWQVIPTAWVDAAQARWTEDGGKGKPMDSMGVDVARGGKDETVIAKRHGVWFAKNDCYPGSDTPNGQIVVGSILSKRKDNAPVHVDVIGVGASVYDQLDGNGIHAVAIQSAAKAEEYGQRFTDKSGQLSFVNYRAYMWWALREALDPETGEEIALPPGQKVKGDLCAPRWKMTARGVQVESKEEIANPKRLGRSTNDGDAIVYANMRTMKREEEEDEDDYRPPVTGRSKHGGY